TEVSARFHPFGIPNRCGNVRCTTDADCRKSYCSCKPSRNGDGQKSCQ
ncbi:hypothetical protein MTO96_049881, partial [Rhipicephalus appendiculatus]